MLKPNAWMSLRQCMQIAKCEECWKISLVLCDQKPADITETVKGSGLAPTVCIHKLQDELTDFSHQEKCVWVSLTQHLPDSNTASALLRWSHMLQFWLISLTASLLAMSDTMCRSKLMICFYYWPQTPVSEREREEGTCVLTHTERDWNTFCYTGLFSSFFSLHVINTLGWSSWFIGF